MPKLPKFVQISAQGPVLFALDESGTVWAYGVVGEVQGWAVLPSHRFVDDRSN